MKLGKLYIGTSGWNYEHWRGIFYPDDLPQNRWLDFYSQHFDTVEINFSFYRLPEKKTFEGWYHTTQEHFSFTAKVSRFYTHMKKLALPEENLSRFLENATGLGDKLSAILFQLPPFWNVNVERLAQLAAYMNAQKILPCIRSVLEVRNNSWLSEDVFKVLKDNNIALCLADWPELPVDSPITADFVYVRRHGPSALYASRYTQKELEADAGMIRRWLTSGKDVYVYFNNDAMAWAVKNALELKKLLKQG
ncbi:MAG: hypothetical protein A3D21_08855 [Nitrospirae bacterium RIFCSPHIGHO2_02_FULL_42_12]|nr:MAG: hypothetical protein A3D21_08855 [Nitrospirae bacterium RIFCSPHIGHO2_02_FULL_42_12]